MDEPLAHDGEAPGRTTALRIFVPFAAGFFFSYLVRNVNAVIAPDLTRSLDLSAATLGLLTSVYFLTFAAFQLPLGVLLDRYGPRRVESVLLVVASAGCALFAFGDGVGELIVARALIGLGVSACLMGSFKAFAMWFPARRLPLVNGYVLAVGAMGALAATAPVEAMLSLTDWRGVYLTTSIAALAAAALIFVAVPRHESERVPAKESLGAQLGGLGTVLRSRPFWRMMPVAALCNGTLLAMQGLWAGPWLKDVAGLDRQEVAFTLAAIPVAMVAGFFGFGLLAERAAARNVAPDHVASAGVVVFLLAQLALILGAPVPPVIVWCLFGFAGTATLVFYAALTARFRVDLAGRVNTAVNVFAFGYAFALQWALGAIIGLFPGAEVGAYREEGYQVAFTIAQLIQAGAFFWYAVSRED